MEEGLMDVVAAFVTDTESAELVQPADGAFHDPAMLAQSAANSPISPKWLAKQVFNQLLGHSDVDLSAIILFDERRFSSQRRQNLVRSEAQPGDAQASSANGPASETGRNREASVLDFKGMELK